MFTKKGQTLTEFAFVSIILVTLCVAVLIFFGDNIKEIFDNSRILSIFTNSSSANNTTDTRTNFSNDD
jgi:hypothetical protein